MIEFLIFSRAYVPQPPPRMPVTHAAHNESEEEKQFRRVFQQIAGDVSAMPSYDSLKICCFFFFAVIWFIFNVKTFNCNLVLRGMAKRLYYGVLVWFF